MKELKIDILDDGFALMRHGQTVLLSNTELAALPPVAALIEAAGAALDEFSRGYWDTKSRAGVIEQLRAALAQFEPEAGAQERGEKQKK